MASAFREAINFFVKIGLYDVILPFLLVFTLMYAFLEKTMVLGYEKILIGGKEVKVPRKNLNSMVAFITGLLVVASVRIVGIMNEILANFVLIILIAFLFILFAGSMLKQEEEGFSLQQDNIYYKLFLVIGFITLLLITLNAIKTSSGESWLSIILNSLGNLVAGTAEFWSIILILVIIIAGIYYITKPEKKLQEQQK